MFSEHGFATHYLPSRRIPILLERLAAIENAHPDVINQAIEELSEARESTDPPLHLSGDKRAALDFAFRHSQAEKIVEDLQVISNDKNAEVSQWAKDTLDAINLRSPTSLKVALEAVRKGKDMSLLEALEMELGIATAYCVSPRDSVI